MGRAVLECIREPFSLGAAFVRTENARRGRTLEEAGLGASDVRLDGPEDAPSALAACDVLVSFASPAADVAFASVAADLGVPLVVGTTGHDAQQRDRIAAAAQRVPLVLSPNFAVGIAVLQNLLPGIAPLRVGFDPQIVETHHAKKRDAPSGTALALADVLARALGRSPRDPSRENGHPIPIASIRAGAVPGDHVVILAGPHEVLRLEHRVLSRTAFAEGALIAARWAASGRPPGLYSFRDVLADEGERAGEGSA